MVARDTDPLALIASNSHQEEESTPVFSPEKLCSSQPPGYVGIMSVRTQLESVKLDTNCSHSRRIMRQEDHDLDLESCHVSFGNVQIREYPIVLGDNPGGSSGPPLSIEWTHQSESSVPLDAYEQDRPNRRDRAEMCMPAFLRVKMLQEAGYSRAEIVALQKPVNITRVQRRRTNATLNLQTLHEITERTRRKTLNLLSLGTRKRKEKHFLEPFTKAKAESVKPHLSRTSILTEESFCELERPL
jgi:hypothetical protein